LTSALAVVELATPVVELAWSVVPVLQAFRRDAEKAAAFAPRLM
jgi:hypothetical protein